MSKNAVFVPPGSVGLDPAACASGSGTIFPCGYFLTSSPARAGDASLPADLCCCKLRAGSPFQFRENKMKSLVAFVSQSLCAPLQERERERELAFPVRWRP